MKQALRGLCVMIVTALLTVEGSNLLALSAFSLQSPTVVLGFSLALGFSAWVAYCVLGSLLTNLIVTGTKNPGALMIIGLNLAGFAIALEFLHWVWFSAVNLAPVECLPWAVIPTLAFCLIWGLGQSCGILPRVKTFLPER